MNRINLFTFEQTRHGSGETNRGTLFTVCECSCCETTGTLEGPSRDYQQTKYIMYLHPNPILNTSFLFVNIYIYIFNTLSIEKESAAVHKELNHAVELRKKTLEVGSFAYNTDVKNAEMLWKVYIPPLSCMHPSLVLN
jgi:hypothetical protein